MFRVYDSTLYEGETSLSTADNILRVGRELRLCSDDADTNALVTRGEAAIILHAVLTQSFHVEEPPAPVTMVNAAGVNVNDFLLELRKVPEQVLDAFNATGWTYCIDFDYMGGLSKKLNMSCIGATNYSRKTIYISEADATLHEFGHFLDYALGFPQSMNGCIWQNRRTPVCGTMPRPIAGNFLPIASSTGSHTAAMKNAWKPFGMPRRRLGPT